MSEENYTHFGIRNTTMADAGDTGYCISEPGYENYQCNLHIRRGDGRIDATPDTETYQDVADLIDANATLADKYAVGMEISSSTDRYSDEDVDFLPISDMGDGALGLEFRAKHVGDTLETYNPNSYVNSFMLMNIGSSSVMVDYHSLRNTIAFRPFNESDWKFVGMNSNGSSNQNQYSQEMTPYRFAYDINAEYVWRMTRTPVIKNIDDNDKGAIIRVYMGKVNEETGMPADTWDNVPVFEYYDPYSRTSDDADKRGLLVSNTTLNGAANGVHTMVFSSSKYALLKTLVDGVETTYVRVERGTSFTLPKLANLPENYIHIDIRTCHLIMCTARFTY